MMRRTFVLLLTLCASMFLSSTACAGNLDLGFLNPFKKAPVPQENPTEQLISSDLLSQVGLKADWQINLPIQPNENVGRMYIDGKMLYILTDQNFLFAVDRTKGLIRFSLQITDPGLPILTPKFYDGKVYITVGNKLKVIDPDLGIVTQTKKLNIIGHFAVCPFDRNDDMFYAVGSNRRLYALDPDDYFLLFMATAHNDSMINSMIVEDTNVIFSSETGNIAKIASLEPTAAWQTDIAAGLAAPIVKDGDDLFVSSLDMKLYRLSVNSGYSAWETPFQTGQPLRTSARIGKNVVYQYAGRDGLYAIDRTSGKKLWNLPKGYDLLTEQGNRAYVIGDPATLYVMDNVKKKLVYSINAAGASSYAVNSTDSTIYLSCKKGRLMAIDIANPKFEVK